MGVVNFDITFPDVSREAAPGIISRVDIAVRIISPDVVVTARTTEKIEPIKEEEKKE